jgi:DNA-directed RNA polymerase specialized sigma24 family protein
MTNDFFAANRRDEDPAVFHTRFWRCHRLLYFIACRVLGGPEGADVVIENCWLKASRNPPLFEYEGAFRSWLVRVLIDEALAILRQNERSAHNEIRLRRNSFGAKSTARKTSCAAEGSHRRRVLKNVCDVSNEKHGRK